MLHDCTGVSGDIYVDVGPCLRYKQGCNEFCKSEGYIGGDCVTRDKGPNHCICID